MRGFLTGVIWGGFLTAAGLAVVSEVTMTGDVRAAVGVVEDQSEITAEVVAPASVAVPEAVAEAKPVVEAEPVPVAPIVPVPEAATVVVIEPAPAPREDVVATEPMAAEVPAPRETADPLMNSEVAGTSVTTALDPVETDEPLVGDVPNDPVPVPDDLADATVDGPVGEVVKPAEVSAEPVPALVDPDPIAAAPVVAGNVDQPNVDDAPAALDAPLVADAAPATDEPVLAPVAEPPVAAVAVLPEPEVPAVADPAPEQVASGDAAPIMTDSVAEPVPAAAEPAETGAPDMIADAPEAEPMPAAPEPRHLPQVTADAPVIERKIEPAPDVQTEPGQTVTLGQEPGTLGVAAGFKKVVPGVISNRLPRIGAKPAPDADVAAEQTADQTPLTRYATAFENPDQRPVFAIILIDDGLSDLDRAKVVDLPFPVSVALDPAAATAPAAAAVYRAAGREVVMLASGIPTGAEASDVAVSFQSNAEILPESVAVLDLEKGGFQDNRPLATLVVPAIKDQGRGVITWDQGLNAGDQVARRDAVASGLVFRRIDGPGNDTASIRRILDKAAFKAAQDGRTIVVADATPETLAALMVWVLEGRGADLAIAPVTAALSVPQ